MTEQISAVTHAAGCGNINNKYHMTAPNNEDSKRVTIDRITQALESYVDSNKTSLDISVNEETGDIVVKVISDEDGKVIREIPSEEVLKLAARMEQFIGLMFDENV